MAFLINSTLETHPIGTGNANAIQNANWTKLDKLLDPSITIGTEAVLYHAPVKALLRSATLPTTGHTLIWDGTKYLSRPGFAALTNGASIALDFKGARFLRPTSVLSVDTTFTFSNLGPGFDFDLIITADGTDRNLTWPAGMTWASDVPAVLPAGKTGIARLRATTTAAAGVFGTWSVQP